MTIKDNISRDRPFLFFRDWLIIYTPNQVSEETFTLPSENYEESAKKEQILLNFAKTALETMVRLAATDPSMGALTKSERARILEVAQVIRLEKKIRVIKPSGEERFDLKAKWSYHPEWPEWTLAWPQKLRFTRGSRKTGPDPREFRAKIFNRNLTLVK
jgi:hypothetical protein